MSAPLLTAADEQRLRREGWAELRRRADRGIVVHLLMWMLIAGAGGLWAVTPRFFLANAAIFASNALCRTVLKLWKRVHEDAPWVFFALLIANPLHWGVLAGLALYWAPLAEARWPLWILTSSVAAAGTMGLSISQVVRWGYSLAAVAPLVVACLLTPTPASVCISLVVGWIYLVGASRAIYGDYWAGARARLVFQALSCEFEHLSVTDALTQVPNRLYFDHTLVREWQGSIRAGRMLSLLMVDIDHFKQVNDVAGHAGGDVALKAVAAALAGGLARGDDLLARYGGEEFIVMLPDTGPEAAAQVAERLRQRVGALQVVHEGRSLVLRCSIGVAGGMPSLDATPAALLEAADKALYDAKRTGRNRVAVAGTPASFSTAVPAVVAIAQAAASASSASSPNNAPRAFERGA